LRLVTEWTVVVEAALTRTTKIFTFAHVYLLVSAKNGKTLMPLGMRPNAKTRRPWAAGF